MRHHCDQRRQRVLCIEGKMHIQTEVLWMGEAVVRDQELGVQDWAYSSYPRCLWCRKIRVCTDILWVKPLAAAFANDNHLRSETAESMVQSVFSHVGSIASDDFWDEESTFAPNKT